MSAASKWRKISACWPSPIINICNNERTSAERHLYRENIKIGFKLYMYESLSMLSFRCVVLYSCLILFFFLFLSLADEIKLLKVTTGDFC